jgi:hypothetical protein
MPDYTTTLSEMLLYWTKPTQSGIFLGQYRTETMGAEMPMPALVSPMPMSSYAVFSRISGSCSPVASDPPCSGPPSGITNSDLFIISLSIHVPLRACTPQKKKYEISREFYYR